MIDINQIVVQHGNGALLAEINDTLARLVKDCCDTGKKGAISIALAFEPMPMREGGHQMKVTPAITSKNPKYDAGVGIFFVVTDENEMPTSLEKDDPRQAHLFAIDEKALREEIRKESR